MLFEKFKNKTPLKITRYTVLHFLSVQKVFELKKLCSYSIPDHVPKVSNPTALPAVHWITVVNGCLDRHGCPLCSPVKKLSP